MSGQLDLDHSEVTEVVVALKKLINTAEGKSKLLQEQEKINLQFAMKKVPKLNNKTIKLALPHSLATPELDVCLFVKDLNRKSREHELTEDHFKDLLADRGISCVTQVIPLKALKLEYKPFEAKKNLSNMFDVFLADERIVRLLPPLLGKHFYGRKKLPIQVNLTAKDLKKEISAAISSGRCIIKGRGSSSMATVAHTQMTTEQIVENVLKSANQIAAAIPGGATNIRNFYIKTESSMALPVYVSLDDASDVKLPAPTRPKNNDVVDEITTVMNAKVKVTPLGNVEIIRDNMESKKVVQKRKRSKGKFKRLQAKHPKKVKQGQQTSKKSKRKQKKVKEA